MNRCAGTGVGERGIAFIAVTVLTILSTVLVGAFLSTSLGKARHVRQHEAENAAFQAAESGLNAAIEGVWSVYRLSSPGSRFGAIDRLDGKSDPADHFEIGPRTAGGNTFYAEVFAVELNEPQYGDVKFAATGSNPRATRHLTALVRYTRKPSEVFNHAYFINNFGWLWGASITVNGSVRSNGNFSLRDAKVNGDIFASENESLGATGSVTGDSRHDSAADYNASGNDHARPTDPSAVPEDTNGNGILDPGEDRNGNGVLDAFEYEGGYDGDSERHEAQEVVEMPYLGDLEVYRDLATRKGGKISQGGTVLVDGVLGDSGGEPRSLILVGTESDPIVIDGPVVIEQDVVIKGVVSGQGTIYAGRNVHIVGDLTYLDGPAWEKPIEDKEAVRDANTGKDALGLAAKGSIIFGDYTTDSWKTTVAKYQSPPFTQPYTVDPSDAENGYISHYDGDGNPVFDGDYTAGDGGLKDDGSGGTTSRKFYESSFSDDEIHAVADSGRLTRVDAILYTNHLLSGYVGEITLNGTIVSRDEGIVYTNSFELNYDVRVRDDGYEFLDIFLPREPAMKVLMWSEGTPYPEAESAEALEGG